MEDNILDGLNPVQKQACEKFKGPSLVIAGAGSGKTRVITYRIANMIKNGVKPYNIITLTFTNKAAKEMRERIEKVVGPELAKQIWMGTYHSIFSRILRMDAELIGYDANFSIYDATDTKRIIRGICKDLHLDEKQYHPNKVYSRISNAKNNLLTAQAYETNLAVQKMDLANRMPLMSEIYTKYAQICKRSFAMDFDDLLLNTNILFRDHPEVLAKYQNKFKYILVDEYQDTNFSQNLIVKKLAEKHHNICVVGDDAQSIYSFRGARIENILNFKKDYPNFNTFKLEENYRSTQNIVDAANSLIKKNKEQIAKNVFSKKEVGAKIKIIESQTDTYEGYEVVSAIKTQISTDNYRYEDFAILYRTNNQSRIFEEVLRKYNIPYKIYSGLSFYQLAEIKSLLCYLRLSVNNNDEEGIRRIINYPKRGIGKTTLDKIFDYVEEHNFTLFNFISEIKNSEIKVNLGTKEKISRFVELINKTTHKAEVSSAYDAAVAIYSLTGMKLTLADDSIPENEQRRKNVNELLNGIKEFMEQFPEDEQPTIQEYLQNVALLTDAEAAGDEDENNKVKLMTIHASKGLEFKNVYIVGVEEKLFPSSMVVSQKDIEEERRLMYVAITRAEENLILSYATERFRFGTRESTTASRFIDEIDSKYIDDRGIKEKKQYMSSNREVSSTKSGEGMFKKKEKVSYNSTNGHMKENTERKLKRLEFETSKPIRLNERIGLGSKVKHSIFGVGIVEEVEGVDSNKKVTVVFNNGTRKKLLLKFARLDFLG